MNKDWIKEKENFGKFMAEIDRRTAVGEITLYQRSFTINSATNGKTPKEYRKYIEGKIKGSQDAWKSGNAIISAAIILIMVLTIYSFADPGITGFLTYQTGKKYDLSLNETFDANTTAYFDFHPERLSNNTGNITSIKISGEAYGAARIILLQNITEEKYYMIYDSSRTASGNMITGLVAEGGIILDTEKPKKRIIIPEYDAGNGAAEEIQSPEENLTIPEAAENIAENLTEKIIEDKILPEENIPEEAVEEIPEISKEIIKAKILNDECAETCSINIPVEGLTIIIEADDRFTLEKITFTQKQLNHPPELIKDIPNAASNATLNLSEYFMDPDNDKLLFDVSDVEGLEYALDGESLTLSPSSDVSMIVYATDGKESIESNTFTLYASLAMDSAKIDPELLKELDSKEKVRVIVKTGGKLKTIYVSPDKTKSGRSENLEIQSDENMDSVAAASDKDLRKYRFAETLTDEELKKFDNKKLLDKNTSRAIEIEQESRGVIASYSDISQVAELSLMQEVEYIMIDEPYTALTDDALSITQIDNVQALNHTGSGVKVCVLDTGVSPVLSAGSTGYNFVDNNDDYSDLNGHGTEVIYSLISSAPDIDLVIGKVIDDSGTGYASDVIAGLEYCAAQNASIVSLSIGGESFSGYCDEDIVASEVNGIVASGVLVVAATGNDGLETIKSPACARGALPVGASTKQDAIASFSNFNNATLLVAPGENIQTIDNNGNTVSVSGTSMSVPFVSGAAALILENESMPALELKELLIHTGDLINYSGRQFARLNAFNALTGNYINNLSEGGVSVNGSAENFTIQGPPVPTLIKPTNGNTSVVSPIFFVSNAPDDQEVVNVTLYTDESGTFAAKETRWNGEINYNSTGLVLLYHFNNETGVNENDTHIYDWSGNGNNGTAGDNAGYNLSVFGKGMFFDGTNDYVDCGADASLQILGNMTIAAWVNITPGNTGTGTSSPYIIDYGYDFDTEAYNHLWSLGISGGDDVVYFHESGSGVNYINTWTTNISLNITYHFAITRDTDSKNVYLYVNGTQFGSAYNYGANPTGGTTAHCGIGNRGDLSTSNDLDGVVDEIGVYNRFLSAAEIMNLYNYTKTMFYPVFQNRTLSNGTYIWNVLSSDDVSNYVWASSNFSFTIGGPIAYPNRTNFDGSTTNFTKYNSGLLANLSNTTLENINLGRIVWNSGVNVLGADFDTHVKMGTGFIYVNSSGLNATMNSSANLTIYNAPYPNLRILRDGVLCTDCTFISHTGNNYSFSVTSFSNYSLTMNVTLIDPTDGNASVTSPVRFISNVTDVNGIVNATLYTNESGWAAKETRWNGEVEYNSTGLVGLWHFNNESAFGENATYIYDWSGNGLNGTAVGQALPNVSGKIGGSFNLDGDGDYIDLGTGFPDLSNATWLAWIYPTTTNWEGIIGSWISDDGWFVQLRLNKLQLETPNDQSYNSSVNIPSNTWTFIAITANGTNISIYLNGTLDKAYAQASAVSNAGTSTYIGTLPVFESTWYYNGTVDEVAVFNRSLSATEISDIYNYSKTKFYPVFQNRSYNASTNITWNVLAIDNKSGSGWASSNYTFSIDAPPAVILQFPDDGNASVSSPVFFVSNATDNQEVVNATLYTNESGWAAKETRWNGEINYNDTDLVALVHFNNESAFGENDTYAYDWSGSGNNGTFVNSPTINLSGGKFGGAAEFHSADNYVSVNATNMPIMPALYTLSAWAKFDSLTDDGYGMVWSRNTVEGDGNVILMLLGNRLSGNLYASHNDNLQDTGFNLQTGQWYHFVSRYNGTIFTVFVNNNAIYNETAGALSTNSSCPMLLGIDSDNGCASSFGSDDLTGTIDEFAFWNRSLSDAEISALYNYSKTKFYPVFQNRTLSYGNYTWNVLGYDNASQSAWALSNFTFFLSPVLSAAGSISPSVVYTNDTLLGYCMGNTSDTSTTLKYHYQWFRNAVANASGSVSGIANGTTYNVANISSSNTVKGDNWVIGCRIEQFSINSSWINSTAVSVLNTAPVINSSRIAPTTAYVNDTLLGYCNATDIDADNVLYHYKWFRNSVQNATGSSGTVANGTELNVANISTFKFAVGQEWILECKADDLTANSTPLNSSATIIINSPPYVSNIILNSTSSGNYSSDNLTLYFMQTDNDLDTVYNVTDWRKNGTSIALINMPFNTNVTNSSGAYVKDYSINGLNGTLGGGNSTRAPIWSTFGKVGGSYWFDGNTYASQAQDYISFADGYPGPGSNGFTISIWFYPEPVLHSEATVQLFNWYPNGAGNNLIDLMMWRANYTFRVFIRDGDGDAILFYSPAAVNATMNTWNHVAVVRENATFARLYVNGTEVASGGNGATGDIIGTVGLPKIGVWRDDSQPYHFGFRGYIDEFNYYNRSLSADQIYQIYLAGLNNHSVDVMVRNETAAGENWSSCITASDTINDSVTVCSNNLTIQNTAPVMNTSTILPLPAYINTTLLGYCNATDIDNDNVTYYYKWFLDDVLNVSGNTSRYLPAINVNVANISTSQLAIGQNWTLECKADDLTANSTPLNSSIKTIVARTPEQVTLIAPTNENTTIHERKPEFTWNPSNLTTYYEINITSNTGCGGTYYENVTAPDTNFTPASELCIETEGPNTLYYWNVRACSPDICGQWSATWNFSIEPYVVITLVTSNADFGSMILGETKNTTTGSPEPIYIQNDGNVESDMINVSANQSIWSSVGLNTTYFQIKSRESNESGSFNTTASTTNWVNIGISDLIIIKELNYPDMNDSAYLDMQITSPGDEPPGAKQTYITFRWRQTP